MRSEEQALGLVKVLPFLSKEEEDEKEEEEEEARLSPGMGWVDGTFGSQLPVTLSAIWTWLSSKNLHP